MRAPRGPTALLDLMLLMTCAAMGLLLRISYELDRARRQRGERVEMTRTDESGFSRVSVPSSRTASQAARVGPARIEPKIGANA